MFSFSFSVAGKPQPKERPRFNIKTRSVRTPERTKAYERLVAWHCNEAMRKVHLEMAEKDVPIYASISVYVAKPKKSTDAPFPLTTPDVDNIAKSCLDAINGVAYHDDTQVVSLHVERKWAGPEGPFVHIEISEHFPEQFE